MSTLTRPRGRSCTPRNASSPPSTAPARRWIKPLEHRAPRRRRLPRRGRQPEPQRRRRVGRPRTACAATPCTIAIRPARSATPSFAISARRASSAATACTITSSATRCAAAPSSAPRSGTAHNRWLTIHGTNYLVVRDCVGYQSIGHGFFLEDGTEVYNVLDRNLAVQASAASGCPSRCCPSTRTKAPASGGPTASTPSPATSPARTTSTASASRPRSQRSFKLTLAHPAARRQRKTRRHPHAAVRALRRQRSRTATGLTASTSAKASTASARTRGIRSSSAT